MTTARCLGVIPARFKSSRAPGKPLIDLAGKPMVQRVWEQATQAKLLTRVIVATEDARIFECARAFGAEAMITSDAHATGSDRVAEVMQRLRVKGEQFDFVANVQGDMPFVNPVLIDRTIETLSGSPATVGMSTVAAPIVNEEEFSNPSVVKVVLGTSGEALYFSRMAIPSIRDKENILVSPEEPLGFKHLGLYVYRPDVLERVSSLVQSLAERREQLEQLRALCNGIPIRVFVATEQMVEPNIEVNTPEDIERAIEWAKVGRL